MKSTRTLFVVLLGLSSLLFANQGYAKSTVQCPSQNFNQFLKVFERDINVQKTFTQKPLKWGSYYPNYGDKPTVTFLKTNEIDFPVLINKAERYKQGVNLTSRKRSSYWYQVFTRSEGSGAYSLDFNFRKSNNCWRLVDVMDLST